MALAITGMAMSCSDPENSDNNANYQPDRGRSSCGERHPTGRCQRP